MPARVGLKALVVLDELELRMRRSASRIAALARRHIPGIGPEEVEAASDLLAAASALSAHEGTLKTVSEELAAALAKVAPGGLPEAACAAGTLAWLSRAAAGDASALERAAAWARELARSDGPIDSRALLALSKAAAATGDGGLAERARRAASASPQDEPAVPALERARAMVALGGEENLSRARSVQERVSRQWFLPTGGVSAPSGGSDPVAQAEWVALAGELYDSAPHVRQLDTIEVAALNQVLFEQSDDGGGIADRTLEGASGSVQDARATPALGSTLAAVAARVLSVDPDGSLVAGLAANANAVLSLGGGAGMRCLVSTQLPVRGWTCWVFEPRETPGLAPAVTTARRTTRRQRPVIVNATGGEVRKEEPPATFSFRVRVPKWALDEKNPPLIKIDGEKANVRKAGGFACFEVPTNRTTKIEMTVNVRPDIVDRRSAASWAREVAISYGPLVLTASARLNPGEDLGLPFRIASTIEELELVGDIRRRLPIVQARALGGGGRISRILFSPISEIGGIAEGLGGTHPVWCVPFRTWHRWGR